MAKAKLVKNLSEWNEKKSAPQKIAFSSKADAINLQLYLIESA